MGTPRPVQASQPGPARVRAVVAGGDVTESRSDLAGIDRVVQLRLREPQGCAGRLNEARHQRCPERSDRAGAPDHQLLAVDQDLIAGLRVGDGRDIRYSAPGRLRRGGDSDVRLPCRAREHVAHATTGGAPPGAVVPDRLRLHGRRRRIGGESCAAAGQSVRAGCGEVDVRAPVGDVVRTSVVAGGRRGGHAEGCCIDQCLVERGAGLRGPLVFALAPADADRGGRRAGVGGHRDGIDEPGVGVGREVDDDVCARRQRPGDLDVEEHLAVGAVRVLARHVRRPVDSDRGHGRWRGDAQAAEVGVEVALREAAAQFDDRDGRARAVGVRREGVDGPELDRRVAGADGMGQRDTVEGARLRPVVDPEHGCDDAAERGRHAESTGAVPVFDRVAVRVRAGGQTEVGAEHAAEHCGRSRNAHVTVGRAAVENRDAEPFEGRRHEREVGRISAVPRGELVGRDRVRQHLVRHFGAAAQDERRLDRGLRIEGRR